MPSPMTRRAVVLSAVALAAPLPAFAQPPQIRVTKDPGCGCCGGWVEHLRASGFVATVVDSADVGRVKRRLGVPDDLASCHTAEIAGYAIEGHVPAAAILRLLKERPQAIGLAVPGMPVGSPGMEVRGAPVDEYDVVLFGASGRRNFARFKGAVELGA